MGMMLRNEWKLYKNDCKITEQQIKLGSSKMMGVSGAKPCSVDVFAANSYVRYLT